MRDDTKCVSNSKSTRKLALHIIGLTVDDVVGGQNLDATWDLGVRAVPPTTPILLFRQSFPPTIRLTVLQAQSATFEQVADV